jgi:hypothetical protein
MTLQKSELDFLSAKLADIGTNAKSQNMRGSKYIKKGSLEDIRSNSEATKSEKTILTSIITDSLDMDDEDADIVENIRSNS